MPIGARAFAVSGRGDGKTCRCLEANDPRRFCAPELTEDFIDARRARSILDGAARATFRSKDERYPTMDADFERMDSRTRAYVSEEGREAHAERKERLVAVKTMAPIICDAVLLRRAELLAFRKRIAQGRSQRSRGLRFVGTPGPQPRAHSPPSVRNVAPTTDRAGHDAGIADRKDRKARRARHLVQMLEVRLLRDWGWSPDHVVFQRNVENITRRQIKKAEEWSDAIDAITPAPPTPPVRQGRRQSRPRRPGERRRAARGPSR